MIPAGSTIGIIGGGQLGRMSAMAARCMGYRVAVLEPGSPCACSDLVQHHLQAPYDDPLALDQLFALSDVVTFEFENVACEPLTQRQGTKPIRPSPGILHITQNRQREKEFLSTAGFPVAPHRILEPFSQNDTLPADVQNLLPGILKTCSFGYDGKGQTAVSTVAELQCARRQCEEERMVLEKKIDFSAEYSVLVARNPSGEVASYPPCQNIHRDHILDVTLCPSDLATQQEQEARRLAEDIATALSLEGLLAIEFFLDRNGQWMVNEMAPRPHNSGHFSMNGSRTSQFENFIRAVCDAPLGSTQCVQYAYMQNLLGETLHNPNSVGLEPSLSNPTLHLHLYEKGEARTGRKMGHINGIAETPAERWQQLEALRQHLQLPPLPPS